MSKKKVKAKKSKAKQRAIYRRRLGRDTWHFRSDCSIWPKKAFEERSAKPKSGELCNQCRAKERRSKA